MCKNAPAFAYDIYIYIRRIPEERTYSGHGNPSRGCLRQSPVQNCWWTCSCNMEYGTSLALTRWLAGALLEKGCGDATSKPGALLLISSMGIPQGSPLSLVLFNVFIKGLADLNQNGPCKIPTLAVDGFYIQNIKGLPGDSRSSATTAG